MPIITLKTSLNTPAGLEHDIIRVFSKDLEIQTDRVAVLVEGNKQLVNGLNSDPFALCKIQSVQKYTVPVRDKIATGISKLVKEKLNLEDNQILFTFHEMTMDSVATHGVTLTTFYAEQAQNKKD